MEDSQIIELYWQKNTDAISETANKYGAYGRPLQKSPAIFPLTAFMQKMQKNGAGVRLPLFWKNWLNVWMAG